MRRTERPRRGALVAALLLAGMAMPALAQETGQQRQTGLQLSSDEPIQIESDKLEVRDEESLAIFTGNVSVVQGKTLMKSGLMKVFYARSADTPTTAQMGPSGASNIERIEVENKVYVRSETQVATADRATFDMASEVLVMTGKEVVLTEGGNVVTGCKLTVMMKTGKAHLDGCSDGQRASGRVKMLIQPESQSR